MAAAAGLGEGDAAVALEAGDTPISDTSASRLSGGTASPVVLLVLLAVLLVPLAAAASWLPKVGPVPAVVPFPPVAAVLGSVALGWPLLSCKPLMAASWLPTVGAVPLELSLPAAPGADPACGTEVLLPVLAFAPPTVAARAAPSVSPPVPAAAGSAVKLPSVTLGAGEAAGVSAPASGPGDEAPAAC